MEDIEIAQLTPLSVFYNATQAKVLSAIEKCLDIGNDAVAMRLDDALQRQKLWEVDINMHPDLLSSIEAKDQIAGSSIRLYLEDIEVYLSDIEKTIND